MQQISISRNGNCHIHRIDTFCAVSRDISHEIYLLQNHFHLCKRKLRKRTAIPPPPFHFHCVAQSMTLKQKEHYSNTVIHTRYLFFFLMAANLMIQLSQWEANFLYPGANLSISGIVFSVEQRKKISGSIQARKWWHYQYHLFTEHEVLH